MKEAVKVSGKLSAATLQMMPIFILLQYKEVVNRKIVGKRIATDKAPLKCGAQNFFFAISWLLISKEESKKCFGFTGGELARLLQLNVNAMKTVK